MRAPILRTPDKTRGRHGFEHGGVLNGPSDVTSTGTRRTLLVRGAAGAAVVLIGASAFLVLRQPLPPAAVTVSPVTASARTGQSSVATGASPPATAASTPGTALESATPSSAPTSPPPGATAQASPGAGAPTPTTPQATAPPVVPTQPGVLPTQPPPTVPPTPLASSTAVGAAPFVQAPAAVGVGEAFLVRVFAAGAARATVEFGGKTYTLALATDRFWGVVGVTVDAAPGPRTLRVTAFGPSGAVQGTSEAPLLVALVQRPVDYLELTEQQSSVLTEESAAIELSLRASQFASFDPGKRWGGRFSIPLIGPQTTAFGQGRSINGGPVGGFHSGMDIGADAGTPVHASADGRVSSVVRMPIRGLSVIIDHGSGVKSGYHHMETATVREGDSVVMGQVVGTVGSTGLSTGPHLHWEVLVWGVNVDPLQWTKDAFDP